MIDTGRSWGRIGSAILLSYSTAAAAATAWGPPAATERRVAVMGTTLDVAVAAATREGALATSESVIAEVRRIEDLLTTWRDDSPLARINAAPVGQSVALDPEIARLLTTVFAWAQRTGRAFDPTVLPLVRVWDLRGAGRIPSPEELGAARTATGTERFRLEPAGPTAARLDAHAGIDEGAWGKGYALDRAAALLDRAGVQGALLDLGGQVLARGVDPAGRPWSISLADPLQRERAVVALSLSNASAATSGNSERGKRVGDRRIGHLLDPTTGEPAPDFGSVTVVSPSALTADILSTALFVMGPEKGLGFSERLRSEGVANEVLFLVDRGGALDALSSPGFSKLVLSADPHAVHGLTPLQP